MHKLLFATWVLAAAAPAAPNAAAAPAALQQPSVPPNAKQPAPAQSDEANLNSCAFAMEGIAWNTCDSDADGYVYEDGKYKAPAYRLARGKQRHDIPAGMRRRLIFCRAGLHPVDVTTGAFLKKPEPHPRCGTGAKP